MTDGVLRYLSLLSFDTAWLDRLRAAVPGVDVVQVTAQDAADVPDELWRTADVVHTSGVLPDPDIATSLRYVQLDTSGVDHVVDTPLWRSSVPLATIGGVSPVPLAQFVLFGILGFSHRLPAMLDVQTSRRWPSPADRWQRFLPASLDGATVGILGYGRIGHEIARLAHVHGMNVIGLNRSGRSDTTRNELLYDTQRPDVTDVEVLPSSTLAEVVGRCDYLVVVCPLTDETRGLVDAAVIARMRPGAVLLNVARGGIVDEDAVRAAVRSGRLAGALLDVFDDEPLMSDSSWWDEPGVFVTPHVAGLAPAYHEQVLAIVTSNLQRLVAGEPLLNLVDRAKGY